jgi:cellulose biosynthesis protein BcsQ
MAVYAIWNNKGGVGKSYLTFQVAAEFAYQHPQQKVLVIDLCPQANSSSMLLGGMLEGEIKLNLFHTNDPRPTISGYIEERIKSPYLSPQVGADYVTRLGDHREQMPGNLYLIVGDERLEIQASRVARAGATDVGPQDAWRVVHLWISDLIEDVKRSWNYCDCTIFIDCNPSFSIYTELALSAAERLLIPFSADGSSKRAVKAVLSLIYGITRNPGDQKSEFYLNSERYRMSLPKIYTYIGNRLTQMNQSSASAFKTVVEEIGEEILGVWQASPQHFYVHPKGASTPINKRTFKQMFQYEVNDANTASVVSGALGIPISKLTMGYKTVADRNIMVNQSQLDKQVPNIRELVSSIE